MYYKIYLINKFNIYFKCNKYYKYNESDMILIKKISQKLNIPEKTIMDNYDILKCFDKYYVIDNIYSNLRDKFNNASSNPLSPQGLIILGYIINTYLLYFYYL